MSAAAACQRNYRRTRSARLRVAEVMVECGRLGAWDEQNLAAIDEAILQLAIDWASVSSNGTDPVERAIRSGQSTDQSCQTPEQNKIQRRNAALRRAARLEFCERTDVGMAKFATLFAQFLTATRAGILDQQVCPQHFRGTVNEYFFAAAKVWPTALTPKQMAQALASEFNEGEN